MALKMTIEPQEWLMFGNTRVINIHPQQASFMVDGAGPVLRQAHTLHEAEADTPAKRTYLAVQRLYLGFTENMDEYQQAAAALLRGNPSAKDAVMKANIQMARGSLYGALREYRKLVELKTT